MARPRITDPPFSRRSLVAVAALIKKVKPERQWLAACRFGYLAGSPTTCYGVQRCRVGARPCNSSMTTSSTGGNQATCRRSAKGLQICKQTYIECKHYRDLQIDRSLLCCTGQLYHFWQKTVVQARRYDKRPLLIARQNRYPTLAITDTGMFGKTPVLTVNSWLALICI